MTFLSTREIDCPIAKSRKRQSFILIQCDCFKKDSIFAIPNITYNSEPVSISVVGYFMSTAVRDMRFRTPVGSINVLPAYVIREC